MTAQHCLPPRNKSSVIWGDEKRKGVDSEIISLWKKHKRNSVITYNLVIPDSPMTLQQTPEGF